MDTVHPKMQMNLLKDKNNIICFSRTLSVGAISKFCGAAKACSFFELGAENLARLSILLYESKSCKKRQLEGFFFDRRRLGLLATYRGTGGGGGLPAKAILRRYRQTS
jgi:hypothetical protein